MHPLILTIRLDSISQSYFDNLREMHFPPHINYLKAHLTLFHHLPSDNEAVTEAVVKAAQCEPFSMHVNGIRHTGFGVAFTIGSFELIKLRANLAEAFAEYTIPQDKQKFQPHITVQNKVAPETSKSLVDTLKENFVAFDLVAEGIDSWLYKNGPWEHAKYYPFVATRKL